VCVKSLELLRKPRKWLRTSSDLTHANSEIGVTSNNVLSTEQ